MSRTIEVGSAEGEPRGIAREQRTKENNTQKKTKINRNRQQRKTLGAGQTIQSVMPFRCSGVQVFQVNDILEGQKGDQVVSKNGQNFGWGNISTFWASSSAKKVLLTAEKVESVQN